MSENVKYTTLLSLKLTYHSLEKFLCSVTIVLSVNKHFFMDLRTGSNLQVLFICWPLLTSAHIIKSALHKTDLSQNCDVNEVALGFSSFIFSLGSPAIESNSDAQGSDVTIGCSQFSCSLHRDPLTQPRSSTVPPLTSPWSRRPTEDPPIA